MDKQDVRSSDHGAGHGVPAQRLPYGSPVLVEYGSVSKLTEGASGNMPDAGQGMMCL
jgi:hypothetical protein